MKLKRFLALALGAVITLSLAACTGTRETDTAAKPDTQAGEIKPASEKRYLIIDTDTGADDAAALILAAKTPNAEILGVTVLVGNVDLEQSTKNALAALEIAGCDAPVYQGAATTYTGARKEAYSVFGEDGMGDADLIHPQGKAQAGDAVDFILDTIRANPGKVEIIALGPATNIANAMAKDRETMRQVKRIWSMGTAGLGPGNATPVADFNVYVDAPAYRVMLDSGLPITVVGLDVCDGDALWTDEQFEALAGANEIGKFVSDSFGKIREFYRSNGYDGTVMNCDPVAVMCALYPDFVRQTLSCHASCITDEGETHGQVIFYREGFTYDSAKNDFVYNVTLVNEVDKQAYFPNYLAVIQSGS